MVVYRGSSAANMLQLFSFDIDEGCEILRLSQKAFGESPQADAFMHAIEWAGRPGWEYRSCPLPAEPSAPAKPAPKAAPKELAPKAAAQKADYSVNYSKW